MLTALISLLSGLLTGALPEVIKEIRDSRNHKRELEFLELQNRLQIEREKANADAKMREADAALMAEEVRAMREHLTAIIESQARPTGIAWIDGFNALLRPAVCIGIIVLFFWIAVVYVDGVITQYATGKITIEQLNIAIWGSLVGEAILGVLGFLFGYRGARKLANT